MALTSMEASKTRMGMSQKAKKKNPRKLKLKSKKPKKGLAPQKAPIAMY